MTEKTHNKAALEERYDRFRALLDAEDKEACVLQALAWLDGGDLDIVELYEGILARAAREQHCRRRDRQLCVWEEHVRTSIIRTVLECCYPHLMRERRRREGDVSRGGVLIVCPTEEYHELGARMAADLFTLCGFDVTFVGSNTPQQDIIEAASLTRPAFVGVSVTNPYNILAARRVIQQLRDVRSRTAGAFRIIVGGYAFEHDPRLVDELGADQLVRDYGDIRRLAGGMT